VRFLLHIISFSLKAIDPSARLIVPLTAGHHVDHQIARAVEQRVRAYACLVGGTARPAERLWRLAQRRSADRLYLPVARRVL